MVAIGEGWVLVVVLEVDICWLAGVIPELVVPCPDVVVSSMDRDSMEDIGSLRSIGSDFGRFRF